MANMGGFDSCEAWEEAAKASMVKEYREGDANGVIVMWIDSRAICCPI